MDDKEARSCERGGREKKRERGRRREGGGEGKKKVARQAKKGLPGKEKERERKRKGDVSGWMGWMATDAGRTGRGRGVQRGVNRERAWVKRRGATEARRGERHKARVAVGRWWVMMMMMIIGKEGDDKMTQRPGSPP